MIISIKTKTIMLVALLPATVSCRVALPDTVHPPPITGDPGLSDQAKQCADGLNRLRDDARGAQSYTDAMTIAGGSIAAAGGITAAIIPVASSNADSTGSKAGTITAAAIAAAGAIIALLSKTADSPTLPLEQYKLKEAQWIPAYRVIAQWTTGSAATPEQRAYASSRLTDCTSSNPPPATQVPPLPEGTYQLAEPH